MTNLPNPTETQETYARRLEKDGEREYTIRKALREHFELPIEDIIAICGDLPTARQREIADLRTRFPDLNQNRFAWKISKTLTIPKEDALTWSQTFVPATEDTD
jgi:hypothetical protein